jgi:hypothetical protein
MASSGAVLGPTAGPSAEPASATRLSLAQKQLQQASGRECVGRANDSEQRDVCA